ncbi:MAG: hypothetical protein R3327_04505 [Nitrosopumilaceae archaeon]|nr:hypothetical protein [Nitrosopumilaceae archaeon]
MEYPIAVDEKGAKIKPELMDNDKLYHCIFKNKVLLFFKDEQDFLNCYEIEEEELVKKIKNCNNSDDVETILTEYTQKHHLND